MTHRYETKIYNIIKMVTWLFVVVLSAVRLLIYIGVIFYSYSRIIITVGFTAIAIVPFVYQKKAMALCMQKVAVVFDELGLRIEYFSKNDDSVRKIKQFDWDEIKSFELHFTEGLRTVIGLYLKERWFRREFIFVDKEEERAVKELSIYNLFLSYCYNYNAGNSDPIKLRKGFLTTKIGTFITYFIAIGSLIMMILFLVYKPQKFPITLTSIGLLVMIFAQRSSDKARYKSMKAYKPIDILKENLESKDVENKVDD